MRQKQRILIAVIILFVTLFACNLPSQVPTPTPDPLQLASQTIAAILTAQTPTPIIPVTGPTETPTITPTAISAVPMLTVSVNTNCRTGPGIIYDLVGALLVGEKAVVVGKFSSGNYWIINNPDSSGTCWLWGEYAAVTGNTAGLPEYTAPPTPTPSITLSPTITLTPAAPAAPANLTYTASCTAPPFELFLGATLYWNDNANNEDGFHIYRGGALVTTLAANIVSYAVAAVGTYGVEAFNAAGASSRIETVVGCP
ncbi:MAG: hypothetical protein HZB19_13110 [Chloroflexi bacterium]|nr:hypothetical protein [Chloroflexota bacterium]